MFRKILSTALVSAAIVAAGPAFAGPGGGGGGGGGHGGGVGLGAGVNGGMGGGLGGNAGGLGGGMGGSLGGGANFDTHGQATRINTQSTTRANANASFNRSTTTTRISGSNRTTVAISSLPGLTAGATVRTNTGTTLGTVSRVITDRNGNILQVFVRTSTGQLVRLSPTALSMNGGVLVANVTNTAFTNPAIGHSQGPFHASPTGIAHANSHSVLAGGANGTVTSGALAGLTTGLNVVNANNTTIGQVSRIVTDANGNIRLVIVTNTSTHQTFRLMPTTLTINGTTVMTTSTVGG